MAGSRNSKKMPKYEVEEATEQARVVRQMTAFSRVKLNKKQQELYDGIMANTLTTVGGQAGTGKTFVACYAALSMFRNPQSKIDRIYLIKPLETSGEQTGFLPGSLKDKVEPYMQSFVDNLEQMMDGTDLKMCMDTQTIRFAPAAYLRGRTLRNAIIVVDECQNFDVSQLMTIVTRLGENSRMILLGDQRQNDINKKFVAFDFFRNSVLEEVESLFDFDFEKSDIVRHPLLRKITDNYERLQAEGKIPETKFRN